MRMPSMNMGAVRMLRNHAEYLMVRLEAVPEVAWILEAFRQMTTPYEAALKAHEDASGPGAQPWRGGTSRTTGWTRKPGCSRSPFSAG